MKKQVWLRPDQVDLVGGQKFIRVPIDRIYRLTCCNCDLVHKVKFHLIKGDLLGLAWAPDDEATETLKQQKELFKLEQQKF